MINLPWGPTPLPYYGMEIVEVVPIFTAISISASKLCSNIALLFVLYSKLYGIKNSIACDVNNDVEGAHLAQAEEGKEAQRQDHMVLSVGHLFSTTPSRIKDAPWQQCQVRQAGSLEIRLWKERTKLGLENSKVIECHLTPR